jgi:hypothetical protein
MKESERRLCDEESPSAKVRPLPSITRIASLFGGCVILKSFRLKLAISNDLARTFHDDAIAID